MSVIIGLIAGVFYIACLSYGPLKGKKVFGKRYTFKTHIFIGVVLSIACVLHIYLAGIQMQFSSGILAVLFIFISILSGVIASKTKKIRTVKHVHVIISILASLTVLLHIFDKLLK